MLFCVLGGDSSWYCTFACIIEGQSLVQLMLASLQVVLGFEDGLINDFTSNWYYTDAAVVRKAPSSYR